MAVFINLGLTSNCSWNLKCSREARSHANQLLRYDVSCFFAVFMHVWLLEYRFLPMPLVLFHPLSWVSFQVGIVGGKNGRADLPCSLGDNNCCRVSLIEGKEISLNFSTCAVPQLAGSQFWSRINVGGLTSDVYELICRAKINVNDINELDVKMIFWGFIWSIKGNIVMTLLYICDDVPSFLEKLRPSEVLNVSLNWPHVLNFMQYCSCLFRICSGPLRISLMVEKEVVIDIKTPGNGQYFFFLHCGRYYCEHLKALETFEDSFPFPASNLCLWK